MHVMNGGMRMSPPLRIILLTLVTLGASATGAAAQACLGLPSRDGQIALAAAYGIGDDFDTLGGDFHADVTGPASLGFSYARDVGDAEALPAGSDGDVNIYAARAAYELYLLEPSICGVAGIWFRDSGVERLGVPLGIGFGKTLRGERVSTTVYALPQYVWLREDPNVAGVDATTSNEFMGEAGVTLGLLPFYVSGGVVVSTIEGEDARFLIRAGLLF